MPIRCTKVQDNQCELSYNNQRFILGWGELCYLLYEFIFITATMKHNHYSNKLAILLSCLKNLNHFPVVYLEQLSSNSQSIGSNPRQLGKLSVMIGREQHLADLK